ncbi:5-formyltetrahydrofolate cyclo-ligase [Alkalicoccobacillus porphyridii]|uniref:5-formyltetrahydrofolate cyclo-ligase n=1 Tax=Alkalicoccobacillus porphyridii TaxID=2597270 RepID=A0A553ZZ69_9BACI|nr:5-formyltetrahydrofolate cyclo-ligase [Alkalicoccobacillus porphyridii]TSB46715.1 5-formyltetrahydrofolate cyclo-ligase [Alkalicoccobacillus porphyridii]
MKEAKRLIRANVLDKLINISKEEHHRLSMQIAAVLFEQPYWKDAQTIALTVSRFPEVDTTLLINKAWEEGKTVVLPRITKETRAMHFYEVHDSSQLEESVFSLMEPIPSTTIQRAAEEIHTMIVPGMAFTREGSRLGLGGGYYDRYLPHFSGETVALLFSCQLVAEIPMEDHDRAVDHIVSPGGIIR